jgi:hypothetical protein
MSTYARGADPHEPLDAVLRAATAPGHPEELAGEHKAAAAFRVAVAAPRRRSLLARVLTVKALVVGAVATSTGVVLATAGGVLPILRPEPAPPAPADPPAVTRTASVPPALPPPDDAPPPSPADEPSTPPLTTTLPPGPEPDRRGEGPHPGKDKKDDRDDDAPGNSSSSSGRPTTEDEEETRTSGPSSRPETPDSPAHGAVTAVPPNGAAPPSQGD